MKLLVLTTRLFSTPASGGEICTARLLTGLRQMGHTITLVGRGDPVTSAAWGDRVLSFGELEQPFNQQGRLRRTVAVLGALAAGVPITTHRLGSRQVSSLVNTCRTDCDAVIVDHLQAWPWLGRCLDRPVMLLQHNVESDNYLRRSRAANRGYQGNPRTRPITRFVMQREARGLRQLELRALVAADVVACLSEEDAQRMRALARRAGQTPAARLAVLPAYPIRRIAPDRSRGMTTTRSTIGVMGTWTWAPNREGLQWLINRVWPLMAGRARLVLAGAGLEGMDLPQDTTVLGQVTDPQQFFNAVDLVVLPSQSGSGIQEKAVEAVASGLPVVATPHALRGLGEALPPTVRVAPDAARFAEACLQSLATSGSAAPHGVAGALERWCDDRQLRYGRALEACLRVLQSGKPALSAGTLALDTLAAD
jgi:glycosyltransferase involved in cell wall biosynthesis